MRRGINPYNRADEIFLSFPRQFFGANDFISQFGTNLVYTAAFDPRIGSRRGTVTHAEGTYVNPVVRLLRDSDSSYRSFTAPEVASGVMTNWVNEDVVTYTSDFSAGVDGWGAINGTRTGNIDGIGGEDDCLRFYADGTNGTHGTPNNNGVVGGLVQTIQMDVYLPSGMTNVTGVQIDYRGGTTGTTYDNIATDQWVTITTGSVTPASSGAPTLYLMSSGLTTFTGANSSSDDLVYVKNCIITQETSNGLIHTAYDPSGNGNDATQTTVANMPKIVDAGVLVTDALGNVAGLGDGADDYLDNGGLSTSANLSIFAVLVGDATSTGAPGIAGSTGNDALFLNSVEVLQFTQGGFTEPSQAIRDAGGGGEAIVDVSLITAIRTPSTLSVRRDGSLLEDTSSYTAASTVMPRYIFNYTNGGTSGFKGKIAAIFIFNADMSAQRPAIEAALAPIYGITLA